MEYTYEYHLKSLAELCRICMGRAQTFQEKRNKKPFLCHKYCDEIMAVYGVNITGDKGNTHPDKMCSKCYKTMKVSVKQQRSATLANAKAQAEITNTVWTLNHHPTGECLETCEVCLVYERQGKKGGYVTKRSRKAEFSSSHHLEFDIKADNVFENLVSGLPVVDTQDLGAVGLSDQMREHETCQICKNLYPPQTVYVPGCQHMFCAACLGTLFKRKGQNSISCPECSTCIEFKDVQCLNKQLQSRLMDLQVECKQCHIQNRLCQMEGHICQYTPSICYKQDPHSSMGVPPSSEDVIQCSYMEYTSTPKLLAGPVVMPRPPLVDLGPCQTLSTPEAIPLNMLNADYTSTPVSHLQHQSTSPKSPKQTLKASLNRNITSPLSKVESLLFAKLTKRKLAQSEDKKSITVSTGGQSILLHKVTKARKSSTDVSTKQQHKRSRELSCVRRIISGKDSETQQSMELKSLPKKARPVSRCVKMLVCSRKSKFHHTCLWL